MSDLPTRFKNALEFVKNSPPGEVEMSNQQKLSFYAIFKQATDGECKGKHDILN
jgi:diazepam-binding inhibitor (GABA receptor modulating acyl-CoA-binding protein)